MCPRVRRPPRIQESGLSALLGGLADHRERLAAAWIEVALAAYPAEAQGFFAKSTDQFRNPVGATIAEAIGALTDGLLRGADPASLRGPLDDLVRIRAVQGLGPAVALRFVFELRAVARKVMAEAGCPEAPAGTGVYIEQWVDALGLLSFELYAAARERIWEIRNRDVTARTYSLLKRAGAVEEDEDSRDRPASGRRPVHVKGGREE
jgi:hypothetical protein